MQPLDLALVMRRIRHRGQRRAPQLTSSPGHGLGEELATPVEADQLRDPAPRPASRVDHNRLADRHQHLRRARLQRQRPPHHQPREAVLDRSQPRSHESPAAKRKDPDVELGVIGLPDLVARSRLPPAIHEIPAPTVLALASVGALSRGEIALEGLAERRARRNEFALVAQQVPRPRWAAAGSIEGFDRSWRRPPASRGRRRVGAGGQPAPHAALAHPETLRCRAHRVALESASRSQL